MHNVVVVMLLLLELMFDICLLRLTVNGFKSIFSFKIMLFFLKLLGMLVGSKKVTDQHPYKLL